MSYVNHTGQPVPPNPQEVSTPPSPQGYVQPPYGQVPQQKYAPAPYYAKPVYPARRKRYWVHAVPALVLLAAIITPFLLARHGFQSAVDADNMAAAGYAGFFAWVFGTILCIIFGGFIILLGYLLVLPARSRALLVVQIVFTTLAGLAALGAAFTLTLYGSYFFS